jgi:hypothetical protein
VEHRHLLANRETRFLPFAAAEVDRAHERVQVAELRRSLFIHDLGHELDLPAEALTLGALARDCPQPFRMIFSDHSRAFVELASAIQDEGLTMPSLVDFSAARPA